MARRQASFSAELFRFLLELKFNNDRAWFEANRARYEEHVRQPLLAFIGDVAGPLHKVNRHVVADPRPNGGTMFRIHRDTRFSKDKSPYKTHAAAQFRHEVGRDVHAPGFYLHLEPGGCFAGCGIWHPDAPTLKTIRDFIATRPRDWSRFRALGLPVEGEMLVRVPRGYAKDHVHADHLRLKDFTTSVAFTDRQVCGPGFLRAFTDACRAANPLMRVLCRAVGIPG